jgi:hypothetical protein
MRAPGGSDRAAIAPVCSKVTNARRLGAIEGATMDAHTLKSMAIVSITEGTKPGYVTEPLLDLTARKVVDHAGTLLGTISRVEIDPGSGAITQLSAHTGGMLGTGRVTGVLPSPAPQAREQLSERGTWTPPIAAVTEGWDGRR